MKLIKSRKSLFTIITFFFGIILTLVTIIFFSKTVISPFTILLLYVIPGLISYFIINKFIKIELSKFLKFIYASISFGSIVTTILLAINFNFKTSLKSDIEVYKILRKSYTTKQKNPTADIKVDGIIKTFIFVDYENIDKYNSVQLTLRSGKLGWKIIEQTKLIK